SGRSGEGCSCCLTTRRGHDCRCDSRIAAEFADMSANKKTSALPSDVVPSVVATELGVAMDERHEEERLDGSLRPRTLSEYIGQEGVKQNLQIAIDAAKQRGDVLDHLLFCGPPGLGKTSMAHIIAREMGVNIHATTGPVIERPGDLAAILTNLENGDVLFI